MKPAFRKRRGDRGSAMTICLILTGLLGLLAVNALRSATTEARLSLSALRAHQAFTLAERGIAAALRHAEQHPGRLPAPKDKITVPATEPTDLGDSLAILITATDSDTQCPEYTTGERRHYEIRSVARAGTGARRTHLQGFYICRELCAGDGCLAAESLPVRSYWTIAE